MTTASTQRIAILGAGSWGTSVAIHLSHHHRVSLWGHSKELMMRLSEKRENSHYLPGFPFPSKLEVSHTLQECLEDCEVVIIAVPSHAFLSVFKQIDDCVGPLKKGLAWITKGLAPDGNQLLSEVVARHWGDTYPVGILSGPSFAKEVAARLPTAITLACNEQVFGQNLQNLFYDESFRVYLSDDLIGVQLCGAVKNVLAIATGISDGLGFGANARAALITRGLAEMSRLGKALGAKSHTFQGLAGLGDLVLTCTDNQSRNRRFGLQLGQGMSPKEAEKQIGQVVEGKQNAYQVCHQAEKLSIELPICQTVKQILEGQTTAHQAVKQLMTRPIKAE